jgi:hypothetical protein
MAEARPVADAVAVRVIMGLVLFAFWRAVIAVWCDRLRGRGSSAGPCGCRDAGVLIACAVSGAVIGRSTGSSRETFDAIYST